MNEATDTPATAPGDLEETLKWDTKGGGEMEIKHWAVKALAASMAATLKTFGAENYVTCEMTYPDTGPLVVTVQRKCGKSPGEVIGELEELLGECADYVDDLPVFDRVRAYLDIRRKFNAHGQRLDEPKRWSWWRRALMRLALVRWR